jgi:nicotinamidase-related amidase
VSAGQDRLAELGSPYVTAAELAALEKAGYGGASGLGQRPVLLVVDMTWAFCGDDPDADVAAAVERYPHASGRSAWAAMPEVRRLVDGARERGVPVVFTRGADYRGPAHSRWDDKNHRQRSAPTGAGEIVPDCGYRPGDPVIEKDAPSAFFGTPLRRWLTGLGADSVVVCGTTTSGCVRATVVDAFSHDLKVAVAADGTFDRVEASHRMSLFDLNLKYADVLPAARILELLPDAPQPDLSEGRATARQRVPSPDRPHGSGPAGDSPWTGAHAAPGAGGR